MGDRRYRAELAWLAGTTLVIGLLWTVGGDTGTAAVRRAWAEIAAQWTAQLASLVDRAMLHIGAWLMSHATTLLWLATCAAGWLGWRMIAALWRRAGTPGRAARRMPISTVLHRSQPVMQRRPVRSHAAAHRWLCCMRVAMRRSHAAAHRWLCCMRVAIRRWLVHSHAAMGRWLRHGQRWIVGRWRRAPAGSSTGITLAHLHDVWNACDVNHGLIWIEQRRRYVSMAIDTGGDEDVLWPLVEHPIMRRAGARWHGDCIHAAIQPVAPEAHHQTIALPILRRRLSPDSTVLLLAWPTRRQIIRRHLIVAGPYAARLVADWLASLAQSLAMEHLAFSACGAPMLTESAHAWPHWIDPPGDADATIAHIDRLVRRGLTRRPWRPALLILGDLSDAQWEQIPALAARARGAPLHFILLQPPIDLHPIPAPFVHVQSHADRTATVCCGTQRLRGRPAIPPIAQQPLAPTAVLPVMWQVVAQSMPPGSHARAAGRSESVAAMPPPQRADWPGWPGVADAGELEQIVERILHATTLWAAHPPGLTRGRLAQVLPDPFKARATVLLRWFDAAGILVEPRDEALRWREPRPLATMDRTLIAARLSDVPAPEEMTP
ncbi:MAG: hypothetical protein KGS47_00325 [Chloroflexi bacterium]|nr:hypothetical protein [Chloroflexota bacterium]